MIQELFDPLQASYTGQLEGKGALSTVLLCESILSFLPSMSTKDAPYHLFKEYDITPITSGVIATKRRINLEGHAELRGGLLFVSGPVVQG